MRHGITRRFLLAGLASGAGRIAFAEAPTVTERPRPRGVAAPPVVRVSRSEALVAKAKLGGQVGFAVVDAETGEVLEAREGGTPMPPASTLKVVTALYAIDRLKTDYRFRTEVLATGTRTGGRIDGDLVLAGGGDPTLDTDRLADLAKLLREAGVTEVAGRFLVWPGALPRGDRIDGEQPEVVSYNPAFGGMNLNFNRVHFQWQRRQDDYEITMHARAQRFSPSTSVAHMSIVDRKAPIFDYHMGQRRDSWSVSREALGKDGARWLPVRFPALYAADVFRTLARSNGIVLGEPEEVDARPGGQALAFVESEPLLPVLRDMLAYSTNLTAEVSGLTASLAEGRPVSGLAESGARMGGWAMAKFGVTGARFIDHSGLGYGSEISPIHMTRVLSANPGLEPLLKSVNLALDKSNPAPAGVTANAKTGTLNFVSSLAGYVRASGGRRLCFAIMTADTERRDAIPPEERERPPGAKGWSSRSRQLQKELIREWISVFT